ncbi:MAG: hypothetical protein IJ722_06565 [Alloprevotella sp.]|nr:hypothetical protein [Alloprevotella sp.]
MKSRAAYTSLALAILFALTVGLFTWTAPWVGDDIEYAYIASPDQLDMSDAPVSSVADVLISQRRHYFNVNGRSVAHTLVQLFCGLWGRVPFTLCNALATALFLLLILRTAGGSLHRPRQMYAALLLTALTFSTYYTPTCQIGYMWMFCLSLAFLCLFRSPVAAKWRLLLFLFSLLAGWGQEALSTGLCAALAIHLYKTGRTPDWQQRIMAAGYALGTLLITLSPGTLGRAATTDIPFTESLASFIMGLRTTYIATAYAILLVASRRATWNELRTTAPLVFDAAATLLAFNFLIGVGGQRQLFGIELLSILLILRWALRFGAPRRTAGIALTALTFVVTLLYLRRADFLRQTHLSYERTMTLCRKAPDGATVLHTFPGGDTRWPGDQFLGTMEKLVHTETGKTIHIRPADEYTKENEDTPTDKE